MSDAPTRLADFRARPLPVARERLDGAVRVVDPLGWLGLTTALSIMVAALAWAIFGSVPVIVAGEGLLLPENAVALDIRAPKAGWLRRMTPVNARVATGQTIAVIEPVEARGHRRDLETRLKTLELQRETIAKLYARRLSSAQATERSRRATLTGLAESSRRELATTERALARSEDLLRRGLATVDRVENAQQRVYALREPLAHAAADIAGLSEPELTLAGQRDTELQSIDISLADVRAQIREIDLAIALASRIVSPRDGLIVASFANEGQLVDAQQPLLIVQSGEAMLEASIFIPVELGKRVRPGMPARISVSTAAPELYGTIKGEVVWVSSSSRSEAELAKTLAQPELARQFSRNGSPIEVKVRLQRDAASANGYAWSSQRGRTVELSRGTIVRAKVVEKREMPLALAIPALRSWLEPSLMSRQTFRPWRGRRRGPHGGR